MAVPPPTLTLRAVTETDRDLVWRWRNEEETRRFSTTLEVIPLGAHLAWMRDRLTRPYWWIGEHAQIPLGVVRIDSDSREGRSWISIIVAPEQRGQHQARPLLDLAVRAFWEDARSPTIWARIHRWNLPSHRLFAGAKFVQTDRHGPWMIYQRRRP